MKRTLIIILIAASIGITLYINKTAKTIDSQVKIAIEEAVLALPAFPARPVWWQGDSVLAVGVVKERDNHDADAIAVCKVAAEHGVSDLLVEVYDVVKIQKEDDWSRIGSANCKAL